MTRIKKLITLESKNDDKLREMSFIMRKPASYIIDELLEDVSVPTEKYFKIKMRSLK